MLSICIPIYNYIISNLISKLHKQCETLKIDFEILIIDDASDKNFSEINKNYINSLTNTKYIYLEKNIGRSAIRNLLAETAKFDKLLFLDCDSDIDNDRFIINYLENTKFPIVFGGRKYTKQQKEKNKMLRYNYGIKREEISAKIRMKKPDMCFASCNFMISKNIFDTIKFREFLKQYGHEDTLFGYELKQNNIIIKHIENPAIHVGLEENNVFVNKTEKGIDNIIVIENSKEIDKNFIQQIKFILFYKKIKKIKLNYIIFPIIKLFQKPIKNYLLNSNNPKIIIFDLYKLLYYHKKTGSGLK